MYFKTNKLRGAKLGKKTTYSIIFFFFFWDNLQRKTLLYNYKTQEYKTPLNSNKASLVALASWLFRPNQNKIALKLMSVTTIHISL